MKLWLVIRITSMRFCAYFYWLNNCSPEEEGNPELKSTLGGLGGLRTIENLETETDTSTATGTSVGGEDILITLVGDLLTDVAVPAGALVGGNEEVIVEVQDIGIILIKRISVDSELNLGAQSLTDEVNVCEELITSRGIGLGIGPIASVGGIDSAKDDVENHVIEEVTELH
jgi:hypothetical protein